MKLKTMPQIHYKKKKNPYKLSIEYAHLKLIMDENSLEKDLLTLIIDSVSNEVPHGQRTFVSE